MYVTHFNRGRIISLTKLDTRRRRRRRRSALLAVAGVYKMKQIPQENLRGKKQFYSESRTVLTRSSLNQRDRLHPYIPAHRQIQWTKRKKIGTDARQLGFEALGFEDWRRGRDGLGVAVVSFCNCKWVFAVVGCVGVVVVVSCNTHRGRAASSPSLLRFLLIRVLLQCWPLWVGLCVFVFLS